MAPRVAKLNGEEPATLPLDKELAGEYRGRLAEELGVDRRSVGLLHGRAAVPNSAELSSFGDEEVLQLVLCPKGETVCGWTLRMLLNELCVEGASPEKALLEARLAAVEVANEEEQGDVVETLFKRLLEEPQHFRRLADVAVVLNARWPKVEDGEGGEKTLKGELLRAVTARFGELRKSPKEEEGASEHRRRALALMSFLGQLFARELVEMDGLNMAAHNLVGRDEDPPGDHQLACALALLRAAGPALDAMPKGRPVMSYWLDRICGLASWSEETGANIFSQEMLREAEELITLRRRNWGKPVAGFA